MSGPRENETRGSPPAGTHFRQNDEGRLLPDPRPPEYVQAAQKKNTVKELLRIRREKWKRLQDDDEDEERKVKAAKCKAFAADASPRRRGLPAPAAPPVSGPFPPGNVRVNLQRAQRPALQGREAADGEARMTLFHWQIRQETQRVGGISPELLNMQDADGDTFLHIAVAKGRRALAYVLASKMARCGSLDVKEHNGQTPLHIAAATDQHFLVRDLLTHGAQINARDLWGRSPLHVCAEKGHFLSLQSIWRTLRSGEQQIDIDMLNYDGLTPLHAAVLSHNAVVKELRTLQSPCSYMTTQLAQRRQTYAECIKTLQLMGAFFGAKDLKSGRTCLHMAAEEANVELLSVFLDRPRSPSAVNVKTFSGNTALHIVSSVLKHAGQMEAVQLLMRNGADPGARNFENELPSHLVPEGPVGAKVQRILKGKYCQA